MNSAELLLADLCERDFDITVVGDQLRCRGPKGALTPEIRERISALKPDLIDRLTDQEAAIRWRMKYMLAFDPPRYDCTMFWLDEDGDGIPFTTPEPGQCPSCDEPQPYDQVIKCTKCMLAAVRVDRIVRELDPRPIFDEPVRPERPRLPSWDCVCGANVAGDWTYCPHPDCGRPRETHEQLEAVS